MSVATTNHVALNLYYNAVTAVKKPIAANKNRVVAHKKITKTQAISRSADARRRHALRLIDVDKLPSYRYAITLTAPDATPDTLKSNWQKLIKTLRRKAPDLVIYWQIETASQSHIHALIASQKPIEPNKFKQTWIKLTNGNPAAQVIEPTYNIAGWIRYLAKPALGQPKKGRYWAKSRNMPTLRHAISISDDQFFYARRLMRRLKKARQRAAGYSTKRQKVSSATGQSAWAEIDTQHKIATAVISYSRDDARQIPRSRTSIRLKTQIPQHKTKPRIKLKTQIPLSRTTLRLRAQVSPPKTKPRIKLKTQIPLSRTTLRLKTQIPQHKTKPRIKLKTQIPLSRTTLRLKLKSNGPAGRTRAASHSRPPAPDRLVLTPSAAGRPICAASNAVPPLKAENHDPESFSPARLTRIRAPP